MGMLEVKKSSFESFFLCFLYVFPKNGEPFIINIPDLEMFGVCVCFGTCHSRFIQFHMFFSNWKFAQQKLPTRKSVSKVRRHIV